MRFELVRLTDNSFALGTIVERLGWDALVLGSEYPWRDLRNVRYSARKVRGLSG